MTPAQFARLVDELSGLGRRVSWLERMVYTALGGLAVLGFLVAQGLVRLP